MRALALAIIVLTCLSVDLYNREIEKKEEIINYKFSFERNYLNFKYD